MACSLLFQVWQAIDISPLVSWRIFLCTLTIPMIRYNLPDDYKLLLTANYSLFTLIIYWPKWLVKRMYLQTCMLSQSEDSVITFTSGTERWIKSLNLTVVKPFRPWFGKIFLLFSIDLYTITTFNHLANYVSTLYMYVAFFLLQHLMASLQDMQLSTVTWRMCLWLEQDIM